MEHKQSLSLRDKIKNTITPAQFRDLKKLLNFVWHSRRSSFYRDIFKKAGVDPIRDIKKPEDYLKLPFLTRSILLETKPDDRLYLPLSEVDYVRQTSGSSGRGVLTMYHKHKYSGSKDDRSTFLVFPSEVKKVFYLKNATSVPPMYEGMKRVGKLGIFGNRNDLENSARFAASVAPDALVADPLTAVAFAGVLSKYYDLNRIKFLQVHARMTTKLQRKLLFRMYQKAVILSTYSMNELGPIGIQCPFLAKKDFATYHTFDSLIYEGQPIGGNLGQELILTVLSVFPTPIVRYKTGDRVHFLNVARCECGRPESLIKFLGRANFGTEQIDKDTMLRVEDLEEVLAQAGYKDFGFELHTRERHRNGISVPILKLVVFADEQRGKDRENFVKAKFIEGLTLFSRHKIDDNTPTLSSFLKEGKIASFSVSLKPMQKGREKIKRIIDHRSE